jgi:hypothetical protein
VRSRAEWAAHAFSTAHCGMVSPLHATIALGGAGPRGGTSDLAVAIAEGNQFAYEVAGCAA